MSSLQDAPGAQVYDTRALGLVSHILCRPEVRRPLSRIEFCTMEHSSP